MKMRIATSFNRRRSGTASVGVLALATLVSTSMVSPVTRRAQLEPFTETLPKSAAKIQMIPVPKGVVKVGDKTVEVNAFWIADAETAWEVYDTFLSSGPPSKAYDQSDFAADAIARPSKSYILPDLGWGHSGYPAINLSHISVQMFCRWLSSVTNKKYRLPTEAEWELACREGTSETPGLTDADLEKTAWYKKNSNQVTHPIRKKAPNKLGLFDMMGNVGEWATDMEGKPVLCGGTFLDAQEKISPTTRKYWSAAWQETDPQIPKSRWWLSDGPFVGFRLVCEP